MTVPPPSYLARQGFLPKSRWTWPILLGFSLVIAMFAMAAFKRAGAFQDEGIVLVYPELILRGFLPYRDFETFYGPANLYVLAGAYWLFGVHILVERLVGLSYYVAILGGVFCFAGRWGLTLATGSTLLAGYLLLPLELGALAWSGGVAFGLWSLLVATSGSTPPRQFLAGLLAAIALLFRPDLGPALILAAGLTLLFSPAKSRWFFVAGTAVGLVPLVILTCAAGLPNVFDNLFVYPVLYVNKGRKLPLSGAGPDLIGLLALHLLSGALTVLAGMLLLRRRTENPSANSLLALGVFALLITQQSSQRIDSYHVLGTCFLGISLLPVSLALLVNPLFPRAPRTGLCLSVAIAMILVPLIRPAQLTYIRNQVWRAFVPRPDDATFVVHADRRFPIASKQLAAFTQELIRQLERLASPGQRLFVGPSDLRRTNHNSSYLYHLLPELTPATYFIEMNPLSANRPGSRLPADIASADWLILDHRWNQWLEPNASQEYGSEAPERSILEHFRLKLKVGDYDLFCRNTSETERN
ncbi:MAG: hypothetical protein QOH88_2628 [Verrucomicrobiota bacterium]